MMIISVLIWDDVVL